MKSFYGRRWRFWKLKIEGVSRRLEGKRGLI
jgi:hypothetical protein